MKLFTGTKGLATGKGETVTVVSAMETICCAMANAEPGEGPALVFPTMSFTVESYDDIGTRLFVADSNVEAEQVIAAQQHLRSKLMDVRARQGALTISNHFQYSYGYLSTEPIERIGLIELMVREALCVGVRIRNTEHRKLVFALHFADVVPVLELYQENAGRVLIPTIMRDLAVTLNAAPFS